jgi:flavin-dependent dehydrogenase
MDADVVVVGAGPVGSTLGLLLRRQGLRTLVLERGTFPRDKACGEGLMPSGARVLSELGIDLGEHGFPPVVGVRYRVPGRGWIRAPFSGPAYGVRRIMLDQLLADRAQALTGVTVHAVRPDRSSVSVETSRGRLRAGIVVGADGIRSRVRRLLGGDGPARPQRRYGLVGHLEAPGHERREITVTLLGGLETYLAPTGPDEVLLAVLGPRGGLRARGRSVEESYREIVIRAHPELEGARLTGGVRGAGPFHVSARSVAAGRIFLCGDATGFLDPLTGDGISAGLAQAWALATLLPRGTEGAVGSYRRWHIAQWRRRRLVSHLALQLVGSPRLADRALRGVARRPGAFERLVEVNDGSRGPGALSLADWAALAGLAPRRMHA